jgi:hypothetical protein
VHNGKIEYRPASMGPAPIGAETPKTTPAATPTSENAPAAAKPVPYARVGEDGVKYSGPAVHDSNPRDLKIAVFGPKADEAVKSAAVAEALNAFNTVGRRLTLIAVPADGAWGKSSTQLVDAIYKDGVIGMIALDRNSSHLAEQLALKAFVPVLALSSDKALTSINIPWIFRLPKDTNLDQAVRLFGGAIAQAGPNAEKVRAVLASGKEIAGVKFETTGEPKESY